MSKIANYMGHSGSEVGSVGILKEDDVNREATKIANAWFKANGISVLTDNDSMSLQTRINEANGTSLNGLIEWHANIGGGTGIEIYYSQYQESARKVAQAMCDSVSPYLTNRGAKSSATTRFGRLGITDDTTVKNATLVELIFLDSKTDVEVWKTSKKVIVETICKTYCEQVGIKVGGKPVEKPTEKPKPKPKPNPKPVESGKPREWFENGTFTITKAPNGLALRMGHNTKASFVAWLYNGDVVKYDKVYADVNGHIWIRQTPLRKINGKFQECWIATGKTDGNANRIDYWGNFK